jgi:hypothetical protein
MNDELERISERSGRSANRLCGLMVRVLGYRSGGPGSIPGTTKKKVVGLERGVIYLLLQGESDDGSLH